MGRLHFLRSYGPADFLDFHEVLDGIHLLPPALMGAALSELSKPRMAKGRADSTSRVAATMPVAPLSHTARRLVHPPAPASPIRRLGGRPATRSRN